MKAKLIIAALLLVSSSAEAKKHHTQPVVVTTPPPGTIGPVCDPLITCVIEPDGSSVCDYQTCPVPPPGGPEQMG